MQYRAEIEVTRFEQKIDGDRLGPRRRSGKPKVEAQVWIDYLFSEKPVRPSHWKYRIDYSGRGGCDDSYDLRYNQAQETFAGTLTELCLPPDQDPATEK
jgi:hypothetical protein